MGIPAQTSKEERRIIFNIKNTYKVIGEFSKICVRVEAKH